MPCGVVFCSVLYFVSRMLRGVQMVTNVDAVFGEHWVYEDDEYSGW